MRCAAWLAAIPLALLAATACVAPRRSPASDPARRGVELRWTIELCRTAARDADADGVDDDCELSLARAFAPEMVVDPRDCLWDASSRGSRLRGGYLFAVQTAPTADRTMRIAYLPAYFRDCGWRGIPCATRRPGCSAHDGDSELIVVDVRYDPVSARWATHAVFLSAHCFGRSDGRCRWYAGDALRQFAWTGAERGAPRVWVARGKHGNYPTRGACDSGHWFYDTCDGNSAAYRFPVVSANQNIGSRHRPLPARCLPATRLALGAPGAAPDASECLWDATRPFRGWQLTGNGEAPTSYARVLEYAAGF